MQSRYYDSNIGRFVNSDTPLIVAVDAESLFQYNIFAYCNNNPISYVDHCGEDAIAAQYYYEFIAALSAAGAAIAPAAIAVGGIALIAVGIYDISSSVSYASKSNSGAESTNPRKYNGTTSNKKPKVTKSNGKKVKPKNKKPIKQAKIKKISKAQKLLDKLTNKIKTKDGKRIDLSKFKNKLKNGNRGGPDKWEISPDKAGHGGHRSSDGGSKWKLLKKKEKIASLDKNGRILRVYD